LFFESFIDENGSEHADF